MRFLPALDVAMAWCYYLLRIGRIKKRSQAHISHKTAESLEKKRKQLIFYLVETKRRAVGRVFSTVEGFGGRSGESNYLEAGGKRRIIGAERLELPISCSQSKCHNH